MKTKNFSVSVGLVGTMTTAMLVIALASVANIAAAQDAPPTISNPFGSSSSTTPPPSDTAPPALTIKPKTPAAQTPTPTPPVTPPPAPKQETLTTPPPLTPPSLVTDAVIPVIQDYNTSTDLPAAPDTTGGKLPKTGPETSLMFLASAVGSIIWKKIRHKNNSKK